MVSGVLAYKTNKERLKVALCYARRLPSSTPAAVDCELQASHPSSDFSFGRLDDPAWMLRRNGSLIMLAYRLAWRPRRTSVQI
jgi:hypothetical protein